MSDEHSAGAAYLAALKQTRPQATGAAAARAPLPPDSQSATAVPRASANFGADDKRKSPRYGCQGSARLREIGSGVSTWATFTDISLHGCYVEAMSTFRVGTKIGLTMEVNGFRVESNGEVRVVYPNLGMGVGFTIMSGPNREQLCDLLRSLSRPSVLSGARSQADGALIPESAAAATIANPAGALQALTNYFNERHILSREEFFRILRKSQTPTK
jgi:hypothetical protein